MLGTSFRAALAAAVVLLAAACGGGSGGAGDTSAAPPPPADLLATPQSSSSIRLTWTPNAGSGYSYIIYRNGREVACTAAAQYSDTGLFAETEFRYEVAAVDAGGRLCARSAAVTASTLAFSVRDVAVGDPEVNYFNVEFTADGRYMVWLEMARDGIGLGTVWHCAVDPDTGALVPSNGKGFRAFDSNALGARQPEVGLAGSVLRRHGSRGPVDSRATDGRRQRHSHDPERAR